jgi:hypothetical protein
MQQSSIRWMVASSLMTTALMAVGLTNAGAQGRAAKVEIEYQDPILNARYPELLY